MVSTSSAGPVSPHQKGYLRTCDGRGLRLALEAGLTWLEQHAEAINSLNVYPVPDGDTGTNMVLTMQSAVKELGASQDHSASAVSQAVAQGALMGARGNSGVILSQVFRGFARVLQGHDTFNAAELANALTEGCVLAYRGVMRPVEGTMLTVAREASEACQIAVRETDDLAHVLEEAMNEAKRSVARTPTLLQVLRDAGVVDAGGQGLAVIMEGAVKFIRGEPLAKSVAYEKVADLRAPSPQEGGYGYDTQFLIQGHDLRVDEIRQTLAAMGESLLVVGDSETVKVHIHTQDPGVPISYASQIGTLSRIIVEDMQQQYQEFIRSHAPPAAAEELSNIGTVVVAPGAGFRRVFESLGASAVVPGGQTMNPSTQELLTAIEGARAPSVIVLPNNRNVILSAQQAKALSKKNVFVVPTRTIPQGVGALLAFNFQADAATNARLMEQAAGRVRTGEITRAVRAVKVNGIEVREGDIIGLVDGELTITGPDLATAVLRVVSTMDREDAEVITVYYGEGVTKPEADDIAAKIASEFPEQTVEVVEGSQPHYPFIVSLE